MSVKILREFVRSLFSEDITYDRHALPPAKIDLKYPSIYKTNDKAAWERYPIVKSVKYPRDLITKPTKHGWEFIPKERGLVPFWTGKNSLGGKAGTREARKRAAFRIMQPINNGNPNWDAERVSRLIGYLLTTEAYAELLEVIRDMESDKRRMAQRKRGREHMRKKRAAEKEKAGEPEIDPLQAKAAKYADALRLSAKDLNDIPKMAPEERVSLQRAIDELENPGTPF